MKKESDANQDSQVKGLKERIRQLESLVLQKDLFIKSKNELLQIKDESLVANRELISEKDRIIQQKDMELQQAGTLVKSPETVSSKSKNIQDLKNTIAQKKKDLQDAQNTIIQRNKKIEDLKKEVSNLKASIPNNEPLGTLKNQRTMEERGGHSKDDEIRTLENQLAHRDHVVRTLEFAYENLEKSSEERIATLWDEIKAKDWELGELRNRFEKERLVWEPVTQHQPASSSSGKIKKEKQLKIKSEPMEY
ncbi:hypothetical protein NA56DRAFT_181067 [Hyaloscypha hepaticicola]|uniref:Uncharacterized protein n=1 Tax=Hyaloscypha hepaticicola TaxID=2082293 RepID=A0A2J6Q2B7_9HELO|nr:hypothetical protein NA56DRAFT_181067 [Hyaloscypha hepaticicola]